MTDSSSDLPGKTFDWSAPAASEKWPALKQHTADVGIAVRGLRMVLEASAQEVTKLSKCSTTEEILETWRVTLLPLRCMAESLQGRVEALFQAIEGLADQD